MANSDYDTVITAIGTDPNHWWRCNDLSGQLTDIGDDTKIHLTTIGGTPDYRQAGPFSNTYGVQFADLEYARVGSARFASDTVTTGTVCVWMKVDTTVEDKYCFFMSDSAGNKFLGFGADVTSSSPHQVRPTFRVRKVSAANTLIVYKNAVVTDANWHFYAFVHTGTDTLIYVDGTLITGTTTSVTGTGAATDYADNVSGILNTGIGCRPTTANTPDMGTGAMSDVLVGNNKQLTATEIGWLYVGYINSGFEMGTAPSKKRRERAKRAAQEAIRFHGGRKPEDYLAEGAEGILMPAESRNKDGHHVVFDGISVETLLK